jgi:hypothetical protein
VIHRDARPARLRFLDKWQSSCLLYLEDLVAIGSYEGNTMKSKALVVQSIPEMAENRASGARFLCTPLLRIHGSSVRIEKHTGRRLMTLRTCLIFLLFLGLPAALVAQKQQASWSNLNALKAGQGIEVIESSMKRHAGEFVTVTDDALILKEHGSDVSLKRESVIRVSTSSGAKRAEHAVIGLVVGGLIGAGIGAASGTTGPGKASTRGIGALIGVVIGAPSGALVGAVIPAHTTVYRAAPSVLQTASP